MVRRDGDQTFRDSQRPPGENATVPCADAPTARLAKVILETVETDRMYASSAARWWDRKENSYNLPPQVSRGNAAHPNPYPKQGQKCPVANPAPQGAANSQPAKRPRTGERIEPCRKTGGKRTKRTREVLPTRTVRYLLGQRIKMEKRTTAETTGKTRTPASRS